MADEGPPRSPNVDHSPFGQGNRTPERDAVVLHVGGLQPAVTSTILYSSLGGSASGIVTVNLCQDIITQASLGHAYVEFRTHDSARRVLEAKNGVQLLGTPMRITWSWHPYAGRPLPRQQQVQVEPHPSEHQQTNNICIKGIPSNVTEQEFLDYIKHIGGAITSHLFATDNGKPRGYAFVMYDSVEAAQSAVKKIKETSLQTAKLTAEPYVSRREREKRFTENTLFNFTTIFMENLDDDVDEKKLREMCEQYGKIIMVSFLKKKAQSHKKSAFVTYADHHAANTALRSIKGTVNVSRALTRSEQISHRQQMEQKHGEEHSDKDYTSLYVKNIDTHVTPDTLRQQFSKFGEVLHASIVQVGQLSKGCGYVVFKDQSSAENAMSAAMLNNDKFAVIAAAGRQVIVCPAQTHSQRLLQMHIMHAHREKNINPFSGKLESPIPLFYTPYVPACDVEELVAEAEKSEKETAQKNIWLEVDRKAADTLGAVAQWKSPPGAIVAPNKLGLQTPSRTSPPAHSGPSPEVFWQATQPDSSEKTNRRRTPSARRNNVRASDGKKSSALRDSRSPQPQGDERRRRRRGHVYIAVAGAPRDGSSRPRGRRSSRRAASPQQRLASPSTGKNEKPAPPSSRKDGDHGQIKALLKERLREAVLALDGAVPKERLDHVVGAIARLPKSQLNKLFVDRLKLLNWARLCAAVEVA